MARCTVDNVKSDARQWLGDPDGEVFDDATLQVPFATAYREMFDCMVTRELPPVRLVVTYTLPANTSTWTPSVTNLGEPLEMSERGVGETVYRIMTPVDIIPGADSARELRFWQWANEMFTFVPALEARELSLLYLATGSAPTTGSTEIALDNARSFLALRTASMAALTRGMSALSATLRAEALGPSGQPDASGGALRGLINPMILEQQKRPVRLNSFRPRRNAMSRTIY